MLFVFLLTFQLIICAHCQIFSKFEFSEKCDDALKPYRLKCGLKANGLEYCAARIHRPNFTCEPLPVDWCQTRAKSPEYYYMEKRTVKKMTSTISGRYFTYPIPVWIEPGAEISVAITPEQTFRLQIRTYPRGEYNYNANHMLMGCGCDNVNRTIWYNARMEGQTNSIFRDPILACPQKQVVITMRFTANGVQTIVDGKLRHEFTSSQSLPPETDQRDVQVLFYGSISRFHFIRFTSAHGYI